MKLVNIEESDFFDIDMTYQKLNENNQEIFYPKKTHLTLNNVSKSTLFMKIEIYEERLKSFIDYLENKNFLNQLTELGFK